MPCYPVQERLQHALPPRNHCCVFFGLTLLYRIVANGLLRRNRWNYQSRVQLGQIQPQRLEFGVPMVRLCILQCT